MLAQGQLLYNFSVTPPDARQHQLRTPATDRSVRLRLRFRPAGQVDATAISAAPPSGNFAFGLITLANQEPVTVHSGSAGRFTTDITGTISAGLTDSNASPALTAATLSGTLSAPDSNGRGTATFTAGGTARRWSITSSTPPGCIWMAMDPTWARRVPPAI